MKRSAGSLIHALTRDAKTVAISGHVRPDGDCVGACLGLYNYLRDCLPELKVDVYLGDYSETFAFLRGEDLVMHEPCDTVYDLFFALDASNPERLERFQPMFDRARRRVVIDHHETNPGFGEENLIEGSSSSTCELLYTLMNDDLIGKATAECLYLGIVHDSGVFKYDSTSCRTMTAAGKLLEKGISSSYIIDETFYRKSFAQNKALGIALQSSFLMLDGKLVVAAVTKAERESLGLTAKELDGIIDQLRVTGGTEAALFLYELEAGTFKASLRSNGKVNVACIAAKYGGGGHAKAAGFDRPGDWKETAYLIAGEIKEQL